jgi:hypothetical protein
MRAMAATTTTTTTRIVAKAIPRQLTREQLAIVRRRKAVDD